ncbi:MAG: hypothetical protein V3W34_17645 [Phycisphaerae bacterium]
MPHRMMGFAIVLFWVIATSWLVWHDIVPVWTAQDPPKVVASNWVRRHGEKVQFGVYDESGRWIGGIWTEYSSATSTDREDEIYFDDLPVLGPACVHVKSIFDVDGRLDEIDISVLGAWDPVRIHGERFPSQFAFKIDAGAFQQTFKIDLDLAGMFSATFRPFDAMPELSVGQAWRMQVFNPIAAVTGIGDKFIPMLVSVVGREVIRIDGRLRDCFIVQASGVKAWVERSSGVVLHQEITLPIGGTITVRYERYDDDARRRAAKRFESHQLAGGPRL